MPRASGSSRCGSRSPSWSSAGSARSSVRMSSPVRGGQRQRARVKDSMAVNTTVQVTMPAMGESVTEGTVLEWHKQEGDPVDLDEVLVEISTDKVDAEVPAPTAGTVVKVLVGEGDTVAVGQPLSGMPASAGAATPAA